MLVVAPLDGVEVIVGGFVELGGGDFGGLAVHEIDLAASGVDVRTDRLIEEIDTVLLGEFFDLFLLCQNLPLCQFLFQYALARELVVRCLHQKGALGAQLINLFDALGTTADFLQDLGTIVLLRL